MRLIIKRIITLLTVLIISLASIAATTQDNDSPIPFRDVHPHDWFYDAVVWAYDLEIMNGIRADAFDPMGYTTRAMLVTVLWRYAGSPASGSSTFADVAEGTWYSSAVAWANENGIVTGHSPLVFAPMEFINREQMYTILYRYMDFAGLTMELADDIELKQFADEDDISPWALDAMYFMFDAGVLFMAATTSNYANPGANAFRGEIAGAMYFFDRFSKPISIVVSE